MMDRACVSWGMQFCVQLMIFIKCISSEVDVVASSDSASTVNVMQQQQQQQLFSIEGRALMPGVPASEWINSARIDVNGDSYHGYFKSDGSFVVNNVAPGSYIVEVVSTKFMFTPVRVDITRKGNKRARKLDLISPSAKEEESYPLKIKAKGASTYVKKREQWRVQDALMNPMVLMVVLPFLLMMVIPKLVNTEDPERQQEMQQTMSMFNTNQSQLPDMAEMFTNWFGAGPSNKKQSGSGSLSSSGGTSGASSGMGTGKVKSRKSNVK